MNAAPTLRSLALTRAIPYVGRYLNGYEQSPKGDTRGIPEKGSIKFRLLASEKNKHA